MTTLAEALASGRGVERSFNCPEHEDRNASASVNVESGLWCCYACGAAGRTDGRPVAKAVRERLASPTIHVRTFPEMWLDIFDADTVSPYWSSRVGSATAELFRCGTHPYWGKPTYPIRDHTGRVMGVVMRNPEPMTPKYLYPEGVSVSRCLFGYERLRRSSTILLCEGAGDVMAVTSALGRNHPVQPVGVYGSTLHRPQLDLIARLTPERVVVGFDNDESGRRGAQAAIAALRGRGVAASAKHPPTDGGDYGAADHSWMRKEFSHGE